MSEIDTLNNLVKDFFSDVCIDKSLSRRMGIGERALPVYVTDWLISRYSNNGIIDSEKIKDFLNKHLPDKKQKNSLLNELLKGNVLKILDSYSVSIDVKNGKRILSIPSVDISNAEIDGEIVEKHPLLLVGNVWGSGTLIRRADEDNPEKGKIFMTDFKPMQTSIVDLDYYIEQRKNFTLNQWLDLLICSLGYNPDSYNEEQKLLILTRLCPLVQPRVNLIELAPKQTGKSFMFSQISRHSWLVSGGIVTRPQLFFNMTTKISGIITRYDTVILDEVKTIKFENEGEIVGALKGYLESGEFIVMGYKGTSEAGFVLLANIPITSDSKPKSFDLFKELPKWLHETALLDRFHALIPGWQLPKIKQESLAKNFALKGDYFGEIMHAFRNRTEYMSYVKSNTNSSGNIRDINAVERLSSGFLKLLFPDLNNVDKYLFEEYCLQPAKNLRMNIRLQLAYLDEEFTSELAKIETI